MRRGEVEGVLFDLDGTLVDSHGGLWDVYASFLRHHEHEPTRSEFRMLDGPSISEIVAQLAIRHGIDDDPDVLLSEYNDLLATIYPQMPAMPHADQLLRLLSRQLPIGLVTSASRRLVEPLLARQEWARRFLIVVTGDDGAAKPDPALYRLAVERLEMPASNLVAVEDGVNGVRAARGAGLSVIGIGGNDSETPLRNAGAEHVVASLDQLIDHFT